MPSANNATATGGNGGLGGNGNTGGNGTEADVFAIDAQNVDGHTATITNGADHP